MEQFLTEIEQKTGMKPTSDKISVSDDCDLEKCWVDVSYLALKKHCEYPLWGGIGYTEQVGHPSQIAKVEAEAEAQRQREAEQHEAEQRRQRQAEQQRQDDAIQAREIIAERERILTLDTPANNERSNLYNKKFNVILLGGSSFGCDVHNFGEHPDFTELDEGDFVDIYAGKDVVLYRGPSLNPWGEPERVGGASYLEYVRCRCVQGSLLDSFECVGLDDLVLEGAGVPAYGVKGVECCMNGVCREGGLASFANSFGFNSYDMSFITARCPDGTQYEAEHNACLPPLPDVEDELHPAN